MNILLTGGAGYIGSHTAVVLVQAGHEVVLLDNFCNSNHIVLKRLQRILGKALPYVEADVNDTVTVEKVLREYRIDAVIHFAGLKSVGESVSSPILYYINNVQGTISLLRAMQTVGVKTIVFSSSATVYGEPQYLPVDENHLTHPTSPYGRTKLYIESILRDVAASDSGWSITNLRYFNPVGAHDSALIGESSNGAPSNLMPFIVRVADGAIPTLSIYGSKYPTVDGTGTRDYIHVMDLAEGHLAALNFSTKNFGWNVFNLGTGNCYSVLELVNIFEKVTGVEVNYEFAAPRLGDIATSYAAVQKAKTELQWQAKRNVETMCMSAWRWHKDAPKNNI